MRIIRTAAAGALLAASLAGVTIATATPAQAACADAASKTTSKHLQLTDDSATNTWDWSVKVWYNRCDNFTIIRSLTYRSEHTGPAACSGWWGVDQIRMNSGTLGGWNPPQVNFDCGDNDPADAKNVDAPQDTHVTCGNDNQTGAAVTVWRDSALFGDGHYDVPLMSIPRPTGC